MNKMFSEDLKYFNTPLFSDLNFSMNQPTIVNFDAQIFHNVKNIEFRQPLWISEKKLSALLILYRLVFRFKLEVLKYIAVIILIYMSFDVCPVRRVIALQKILVESTHTIQLIIDGGSMRP